MESKIKDKPAKISCLRCDNNQFWQTSDNRLKCKKCRYLFTPKKNPFKIEEEKLREIVSEFLLEHSVNVILQRIKISKYKLLKILTVLRILLKKDLVESFEGKIKINKEDIQKEIENTLKNRKIKNLQNKQSEKIFGIFCNKGKCFTNLLLEVNPKEVKNFLKNEKTIIENKNENEEFAIVYKKYLYRITKPKQPIDTISLFWGYLKRKLAEKGGVRKEKLPLYLCEYSWRFNNQKKSLKEKQEIILKNLKDFFYFQNF